MLYLVATPIGNLEDITYRAARVLGEADIIYAEDTRRTLSLMRHLNISKPILSCHEHNERSRAHQIIERLREGQSVALVSDAGLPGLSDPGALIVAAAIEARQDVTVLPGACAATTAWVLSGIPGERFAFEGFLPREKKARTKRLEALARQENTLILYESPLRLSATLNDLNAALGDRRAAVCRELTKLHETCERSTLSSLAQLFSTPPKGECVIVVEGAPEALPDSPPLEDLLEQLFQKIANGERPKDAAKSLATPDHSANDLYARYLKAKG